MKVIGLYNFFQDQQCSQHTTTYYISCSITATAPAKLCSYKSEANMKQSKITLLNWCLLAQVLHRQYYGIVAALSGNIKISLMRTSFVHQVSLKTYIQFSVCWGCITWVLESTQNTPQQQRMQKPSPTFPDIQCCQQNIHRSVANALLQGGGLLASSTIDNILGTFRRYYNICFYFLLQQYYRLQYSFFTHLYHWQKLLQKKVGMTGRTSPYLPLLQHKLKCLVAWKQLLKDDYTHCAYLYEHCNLHSECNNNMARKIVTLRSVKTDNLLY